MAGESTYDADDDGHVAIEHGGDDCDDTDPNVSPSSLERCNAVDDDCDGTVDEPDLQYPDDWPVGCTVLHPDADRDGFGSSERDAILLCACPHYLADPDHHPPECHDGLSWDGGCWMLDDSDCRDAVPDDHPGAPERIDGVDNDCDGLLLLIDLDCDDDGAYAALPRSGAPETPAAVGLSHCAVHPTPELTCFSWPFVPVCSPSGFWALRVSDLQDSGAMQGAERVGQGRSDDACAGEDCDDLCHDRCPGLTEECDARDSDCSRPSIVDLGGVPSSLVTGAVTGTVNAFEADLDGDGLPDDCERFDPANQTVPAVSVCADAPLDTDSAQPAPDRSGCTCVSAPRLAGWMGLAVVLATLGRRRRLDGR